MKHNQAELDAIVDGHAYDFPDLVDISSATHYYPENVVILTSAVPVTSELRRAIYRHFGDAAALASRPLVIELRSDSREADGSPLAAGAAIAHLAQVWHCTMGWTWLTPAGTAHAITAGHCFPYRSEMSVATNFVSWYGYETGWVNTADRLYTTYEDGHGTWGKDGDIALIDLTHTPDRRSIQRSGSPRMWTGGPTSTTTTTVTGVDQWSRKDLRVCYSGRRRGVQCGRKIDSDGDGGYVVKDRSSSYRSKRLGIRVTHVARATKGWGKCTRGGDSGAPVYVNTPGVGIAAHGILSGGGGGGNDDFVGKFELGNCTMWFTEIGQAYQRWAGYVQTTD